MKRKPPILILDVATTGFSPDKDSILEIGLVLVDTETLDVLDTHSSCVRYDGDTYPDFHEALVQECRDANTIRSVEGFLLAGEWTRAAAICLQSRDDFDLRFLKKHMPTLERALPRLRVDLKALELLFEQEVGAFRATTPRTYRAGDDCILAYEELLWWLGVRKGEQK